MNKLIASIVILASTGTCFAQSVNGELTDTTGFLSFLLQFPSSPIIVFEDSFETIPRGLCESCVTDGDCLEPTDQCLALDGGYFCGQDCSEGNPHGMPAGECPEGYTCQIFREGGFQCRPTSFSCTCFTSNDGETRLCSNSNAAGTCEGYETCDSTQGWVGCTAAIPAAEVCDGIDNDCNGHVDDDLAPVFCPLQAGVCAGSVTPCRGELGYYYDCGAAEYGPDYEATELSCDGKDNDCNGLVDEGCACATGSTQICVVDGQEGLQICVSGFWDSECHLDP